MAFPDQNLSPVFKMLRDVALTTKDFGYYFFSPGQARLDLFKIFQGHHIIPTGIFGDLDLFQLFQGLTDFNVDDPLTNRAWLPANDADAVRLGSAKHTGSHGEYDRFVKDKLNEIQNKALNDIFVRQIDPQTAWATAAKDVKGLQQEVKYMLQAVGGDGRPLLVLNATDPRLEGTEAEKKAAVKAIIDDAIDNHKVYNAIATPNGLEYHNGSMKSSKYFIGGFDGDAPGTYGHALDFDADGVAHWDTDTHTRIIANDALVLEMKDSFNDKGNFASDTAKRNVLIRLETDDHTNLKNHIKLMLDDPDLYPDGSPRPLTLEALRNDIIDRVNLDPDNTKLNRKFAKYIIDNHDLSKKVAPRINAEINSDTDGSIAKFIDISRRILNDPDYLSDVKGSVKFKVAFGLAALGIGGVNIKYKYEVAKLDAEGQGQELSFGDYVQNTLPGIIASAPIAIGLIGGAYLLAATGPLGGAIVLGATIGFGYLEFKEFLGNYITVTEARIAEHNAGLAEGEEPIDGGFKLEAAKFLHGHMLEFDKKIKGFFDDAGELLEAVIPDLVYVDGDSAQYQYEDNMWMIGSDGATLLGNDNKTIAVHTGYGELYGADGDDILFGLFPDYVFAGTQLNPEVGPPEDGEPDLRIYAAEDLHLTIDGGDGNDNIFVIGGFSSAVIENAENGIVNGAGAHVIGGKGQDLIFSWSHRSQVWGNEIDATKNQTSMDESDMFWWSPGAFVQDADPVDFVSVFGFTLTGGSNFLTKFGQTGGNQVIDSLMWFMGYSSTDSGQLLIHYLKPDLEYLTNVMIIEDYDYASDFTGAGDEVLGIVAGTGDLGLRFRVWNADDGVEISLFNAMWGEIAFYLGQFGTFVKGLNWRSCKDPLVLDLDGDGLETVRVSQSRANFDFDDDFFAERTGWVDSDDGLLAVDRNADGVIDDISELFGGNNPDGIEQTGFAALSDFDSNLDGVVDASDADFDQLLVWRDLDDDGKGESGDADGFGNELFTLEELGISSISTGSTAFDESTGDTEGGRIIASGATLLSEGSYTRTDGSTGAVYEVIFETDTTRTIYRGNTSLASWNPAIAAGSETGTAINATGRGRSTDLAISAANDPLLSAVIAAQLSQMGVAAGEAPDLAVLRDLAAPVVSAWAAVDPLSRELTPTLVSTDGTSLLDTGVYVEDAEGGYWTLASGADVLDAGGAVIARASLADVLAQNVGGGSWQLEQLWSPSDRAEAVTLRPDAPYLVEMVDGRAQVLDYGVWNEAGSYWELASGADVLDANDAVIAAPSLEDVLVQASPDGQTWQVEAKGFNEFAALPFEQVGVQLVDGIVTDFSIYVEDADGGFYVWARNLDRAIELQEIEGRPGGFSLRNYEIDFDTLAGADSTDDSHYRVEVLSTEQFRFATALYGVEFQPEILAPTIAADGTVEYSVTDDVAATVTLEPGQSQIDLAIEFFDLLMDIYIPVERGLAVRLAMQGGLAELFDGLRYNVATDTFEATTELGLVPMFDAIFAAAPANDPDAPGGTVPAVQLYLREWADVLDVIYPDYGRSDMQEVPLLRAVIAAYENVDPDLDIFTIAHELGIDESKIITHEAVDTLVLGTDGRDYIYMGAGDQTFKGGQDKDFYIVGEDFGSDVIEDIELFQENQQADSLWFAHVKSTDVHAYKDGIDLIIEVVGTDNVLTIRNQFDGVQINPLTGGDFSPNTEMVTITFADGVTWEERDIALATSHPLDSNDFVMGTPDYDLMDGGLGNDILQGGSDSDVYVFSRGYGVDTIRDTNREYFQDHIDILQFTGDIRAEHLELQRLGTSDDLVIYLLDDEGVRTGDQVNIEGQFSLISVPFFGDIWFDRLERLTFANGSYLDEQQIMAQVLENAGTDGDDIIFGFSNDDTLDGGLGNDVLQGFNKNDTYIFGRDYGRDIIEDNSTAFPVFGSPQPDVDTLKFTDGLTVNDFELIRDDNSSSVTFRIIGTDDQITITNQFELTSTVFFGDYYFDGVEFFEFSDGTVWDMFDLARRLIGQSSTDGDDSIYGFDMNDVLDGGAGNDRLEGGVYSDTYIFARGYGHDVIYDASHHWLLSAGYDTLDLNGIALNDVEFSRDRNDLILTITDTGETLRIEEQWNRFEDNRIDQFSFTDFNLSHTNFLPEHIDLVGTNAGETLYGTNYSETIDGRGGDDTLIGYSDGDTYLFDVGYGDDIIDERQQTSRWSTPDDTVRFGADITVDNIQFSKAGNDLVITITDRTDTLTILDQFDAGARDGVERFEFTDGTVYSISDVEELLSIVGGGRGDDIINGIIDQENVLDGRQGDDQLFGGELSDTYAFGTGYDLDQITESEDSNSAAGAVDRVVFTTLVSPDDIVITRDGNDLIFLLEDTADQLRIIDGLGAREIEQFVFANGTVWTTDDIQTLMLEGSEGSDLLVGFDDRDDILNGGAGADDLQGGTGDDVYHFNLGYGDDAITDTGGTDVIDFGDLIGAQSLLFSRDEDNLVIHFVGADDTLAIRDAFSGSATHVETLRFTDGTEISFENVLQGLLAQGATASDDVITGTSGVDTLSGGEGNDLLSGQGGADTYIFQEGDGRDIIDDGANGSNDRLYLTDYAAEDVAVRRANVSGNDVVLEFDGSADQVLIRNGLGSDGSSAIEIIEFGNGVRWTISDLRERALAASISDSNDSVRGFETDDVLEAGAGDDFVYGGTGSDTYVFSRLDGRDVIDDRGHSGDFDKLILQGYLPEEIIITRPNPNDNTLKILFADTLDEILVIGQFGVDTSYGLEHIEFGDGTVWDRTTIIDQAIGAGTDAGETLTGNNGDNILQGRGGDDILIGGDGSDTYVFNRGDGQDIINDNGSNDTDILRLSGFSVDEVILTRELAHSDILIIRFVNSDDEVRISGQLNNSSADQIENIIFDDGIVWGLNEMSAALLASQQTSGDDYIDGTTLSETLEGGLGSDLLRGGDGNDDYVFTRGDGQDIIQEVDTYGSRNDRLILNGYDPTEVILTRHPVLSNDLIITFTGTSDQIYIVDGLSANKADIENIVFDNGTIWSRTNIDTEVASSGTYIFNEILGTDSGETLIGTGGDDRIVAERGDDIVSGGLGLDYLTGGRGNDIYIFARGDGHDFILDDSYLGDNDTIQIQGYAVAEVVFSLDQFDTNNLIISFTTTNDQITVLGTFARTNLIGARPNRIENFVFDDGTSWGQSDVLNYIFENQSTDGDDQITGNDPDNILGGGLGDDFLSGGLGRDTYVFARGDGYDVILDDSYWGDRDTIQIQGYTTSEVVFSIDEFNADNLVISFEGTNDQITVLGEFEGANIIGALPNRIENFVFDDGTSLSVADVLSLIEAQPSSDANDTITGSNNADIITGGLGDDLLSGGNEGDTYIYNRGDGSDIIEDNGDGTGTDTIEIRGFTQGEISFSRLAEGSDDLVIRFAGLTETITVMNTLSASPQDTIESIYIVDGTITLTIDDIRDRLFFDAATDRSDIIFGTGLDDIITGAAGSDVMDGGAGDDTYVYRAGDGEDRISDTGNSSADIVRFMDYNIADIASIRRSPGNGEDVAMVFTGTNGEQTDVLIVENTLQNTNAGVEAFEFADGTSWDLATLRAEILNRAGLQNSETIWGFDSDDILNGGQGDDVLRGGDGSDQYIYNIGDGADIIDDDGDGDTDTVIINGYSSLEASVERYYLADDGFTIHFAGNNSDSITILNTFSGRADDTIEAIQFSNGVTWTMADVQALLENNAPVAERDGFFNAVQGNATLIAAADLMRNDFDADGDTLSIIAVSNAAHGFVQLDADGNILFTADPNYVGAASFEYTVSDGNNGLSTTIVNVRVRPPATAIDDLGLSVNEDETLTIAVERLLANDIDGDLLIISSVINAVGGTVSLSSNGNITFIPDSDFVGQAQFVYVANTPDGGRAEATVYIDVLPVNDAPEANDDSGFETLEDQPFIIDTLALLQNDTDIDGDILTITNVVGDQNVTATLQDDGTIYVVPNAFYFGAATLTYTVEDPDGETSTATVSINVLPVNNAPEPAADSFKIDEDAPLFLSTDVLLANDVERDGDALTITRLFGATHGGVELFDNGTFLFTPSANFYGQAGFFYEVSDGQGGLSTAFVAVQVNPINDAPDARDESYDDDGVNFLVGTEDQPFIILASDLLANDQDIDSLNLIIQSVSTAVNGSVSLDVDGNIVFTPDPDFWGEASFHYVVADEDGAVDEAQVTVYINPVSDAPPVAGDDSFDIFEDVVTVIDAADILANDTDIDGDELSIISVFQISSGSYISLDADGNLVVDTPDNFNGLVLVDYTVSDGFDGTDIGRIAINVQAVNDAPTAVADTFTATLHAPIVVRISDLLANDYDVDELNNANPPALDFRDALNVSVGTISVYDDEFVVIELPDAYAGDVSFEYSITDSLGAAATGQVSGTVSNVQANPMIGTAIRDLLIGTQFADTINGLGGNDDLFGREGNDVLIGGDGADNIDGGDGIDTVDYTGSNIGIRVDLETRLGQGGHAQGDLLTDIENVIGTIYSDELYGDLESNRLEGLAGSDTLDGRSGNDWLYGGAGNDELIGGVGADHLFGGDDIDTANYADSNLAVIVSLETGTGTGGHAEGDTLDGIENLIGSRHDDILIGNIDGNTLSGGRGDDDLRGGGGNDALIGGRGADHMDGGDGDDTADYSQSVAGVTVDLSGQTSGGGDAAGDTFTNIERIHGSHHDDVLIGDDGDNIFRGNDGADDIQGGGGFDTADYINSDTAITIDLSQGTGLGGDAEGDTLSGVEQIIASAFDDTLIGSDGADTFEGELGDDMLQGGLGSDTYLFGYDSGNDTITENGEAVDIDRLVLDGDVQVADVSFIRDEDTLLIEIEHDDGFLVDTVRVTDHFLGESRGLEEIVFADGTVYDRDDIFNLYRNDQFNAQDDLIRFAYEDLEYLITADRLTENDTENNTDQPYIISVGNGVNGTATLNADGTVTFLSAENFHGEAFFDYTVSDGRGRESTATVQVDTLPTNDTPTANDDTLDVLEDQQFLSLNLLLANDTDIDGDDLSIISVGRLLDADGNPVDGHASPSLGRSIFLDLDANYFGAAGLSYTVADGSGATATANVFLNVIEVNDAPETGRDSYTIRQGDPITISITELLANDSDVDGDTISFVSVQSPANGSIEILYDETDPDSPVPVSIIFTPNAEFLGDAGFAYTISDGRGGVTTTDVEITVSPQNDPPTANNDSYTQIGELVGLEDGQMIIDPSLLLANDTDPNGDVLSIIAVGQFAEHGDVFLRDDGMIVFAPNENYNGEATFTYTVSDGRGGDDTAIATLNFEPQNDGPLVHDDHLVRYEGGHFVITAAEVFANDSDPDGDVLFFDTFTVVDAEGVSVSLVRDGDNIRLVGLDSDYFGEITIEYTAVDSLGGVSQNSGLTYLGVSHNSGLIYLIVLPQREGAEDVVFETDILESQSITLTYAALIQGTDADVNMGDFEGDIFDIIDFGAASLGSYALGVIEGTLFAEPDEIVPGQDLTLTLPDNFLDEVSGDVSITNIGGGAVPSWIAINGSSIEVNFPANFTGSYDLLFTVTDGPRVYEKILRIIHGNETDITHNVVTVLEPALDTNTASEFDLLNLHSEWAAFEFTEIADLRLTDSAGAPLTELTVNAQWNENADTGMFTLASLSIAGRLNDFVSLTGTGVKFRAVQSGGAAIDVGNLLTDLFADGANQVVIDGGQAAISAVSPDAVPETLTFVLPDEYQSQSEPITAADLSLSNGTNLPDWVSLVTLADDRLVLQALPPSDFNDDGLALLVDGQAFTLSFNDAAYHTVTYTADAGILGTDTIAYQISDSVDGVANGSLVLNILDADVPPEAGDDTIRGAENSELFIATEFLLANDKDNDDDPIRTISVQDAVNGQVSLVDGGVIFTPDTDFSGLATFTYTITDDTHGTSTATVTVDVLPSDPGEGNTAPVADSDSYTGTEDEILVISIADILGNDTDAEGDTIEFISVERNGTNGQATTLFGDNIYFAPNSNFNGDATFSYVITDGQSTSTGTITVNYLAVNDVPTAVDDSGFEIQEDQVFILDPNVLLANDYDIDSASIEFVGVSGAFNGTVAIIDGQIVFTSFADYFGNASFDYTIRDAESLEATATAFISITPENDLPTAIDDTGYEMDEEGALTISIAELLANDSDRDGDEISFVRIVGDIGVTVVDNGDGTLTVSGNTNFFGSASFEYEISDPSGLTTTAHVHVNVLPVDDSPNAVNDVVNGTEDTPVVIPLADLIANDSDPDGHNIQITGVGDGVNGTVAEDGVGNIIFTPDANYSGVASFTYTLTDSTGAVSTATVTVNIAALNDAPEVAILLADQNFDEDSLVSFEVPASSFTDVDGDELTLTATLADGTDLPSWLSFNGNTFSGQPPANYNGDLDITVTASDGELNVSDTFTLSIAAVNDAPEIGVVLSDISISEDAAVTFTLPNDTFVDPDGGTLTLNATLAGGATLPVWLSFDGSTFSGQSPANFNGDLDIIVTASDGDLSVSQSFILSISAVNDAPLIGAVTDIETDEDTAFSVTLPDGLASDVDGDDLTLSLTLADGAALPDWVMFDGNTISGQPPVDFFGSIDLLLTVSDGDLSATSAFNLNVNSVNDAPVGVDDQVTGVEDQTLVISILSLLENDFDVENNSFQLTAIAGVIGGTAVLDGLGNIIFTPDANFNGTASFSYTVTDIFGGQGEATVEIDVEAVNDAPDVNIILPDQGFDEDAAIVFALPDNAFTDIEGDALTLTATRLGGVALPEWLTFEDGQFTGTPPGNFNGIITIVVTASDGQDETTQTFDLVIAPVNDGPQLLIPLSNRYVVEDAPFDIALQHGAFSDPDGDILTLTATLAMGEALPAWLMFEAETGRLFGTPPADFTGALDVLITASDGELSVSNSFLFTVVNVNDAPIVNVPLADVSSEEDQPVSVIIPEETFTDVDGDELSLTAHMADGSQLPEWLSFDGAELSGQPPEHFNGILEITIQASDGITMVEDSFVLDITPVEDVPVANNDYGFAMSSGGSIEIAEDDILANDFDADGDELSLISVGIAGNGQVALTDTSAIIYTPNDSFFGFDTFEYTISDGDNEATATVGVLVEDNYLEYDTQGTTGNDIIFGNLFSRNSIYGNAGNDILLGGFRADLLAGGAGDDFLLGLSGRDTLHGGSGNDLLLGGRGRDTLWGGSGDDFLFGGSGRDTFIFSTGDGVDTVEDFNPGRTRRNFYVAGDNITIDVDGIDSFVDLMSYASRDGRDLVFDFGDGDMLILNRTRLAALDEDAFTFV